jgi:hypothetical protein
MSDAGCDAPDDLDAFLAWEGRRPERFEYWGGTVRLLPGRSAAHERIALNLYLGLRARLRTKSRRDVHRTNLRIVAREAAAVLYPDVLVRCGPLLQQECSAEDPVVVFAVLADIDRCADRARRRLAYQRIATMRTIVHVEEVTARLEVWRRGRTGWAAEPIEGMAGVLELPEIRVKLPLVEIYEAVDVAPALVAE